MRPRRLPMWEMQRYKQLHPLQPGERVDIAHKHCPAVMGGGEDKKKRLNIRRTDDGTTYLFRCNHCGYSGGLHLSPAQAAEGRRGRLNATGRRNHNVGNGHANRTTGPCILPKDTTFHYQAFSARAKHWLHRGGIVPTLVQKFKLGYSPDLDRVVLPVWREGELKCYQTRRLKDDDSPKYLSYGAANEKWLHIKTGSKVIVLVEDYLSAIRVSPYADSVALFTTSLTTNALNELIGCQYDRAVVWLDNDNSHVKRKERELKAKLGLYINQVDYVQSIDPKLLSDETIATTLGVVANDVTLDAFPVILTE